MYKKNYKSLLLNFLLCMGIIFLAFVCFYNLGEFPIADWDEARHGVSAYEMIKNKEYIINTYNYQNDYWNLKPPLSFWGIVMCFKLFGFSIVSFRITSGLAMLITGAIITIFLLRRYGKLEAVVSIFLFSSCMPLYQAHTGRHGDADSLFILFFVISMISMLSININRKYLYLGGGAFSLAFLTKSWHALIIVAIAGMFLLITGEIKKIKIKEWFYFILSFSIPIVIWMSIRVIKDGSKFLTEMVSYDLMKRTSEALEGNSETITYYFRYMLLNWTLLDILIAGLIIFSIPYIFRNFRNYKNEVIGYSLWIILPLIVFTIAKTKLAWYIIPVYIPVIMVGAIIFAKIIKSINVKAWTKFILATLMIISTLFYSYKMIRFISNPPIDKFQVFLKESLIGNSEIYSMNAYIDLESSEWRQSQLFLGELYGDLKCNSGGIEEFKKSSDTLLITTIDKYNEFYNIINNETIVFKDNEYIILKKEA